VEDLDTWKAVEWNEEAADHPTSPEALELESSDLLILNSMDAYEQAIQGAGGDANVAGPSEESAQCVLIRDVFGNPFRGVTLDPAWLTPGVAALAQAAYDQRIMPSGELDITRLAVLADALEDAGCTDVAILEHLRSPGPHVRGCWALDLLLGKS
jgi:hypothetical protein